MTTTQHKPRMGVTKTGNEYLAAIGYGFFDDIPKAVWAAIAISFATCGGDRMDEAQAAIAKEWHTLYKNGIVPQAPNKRAREVMSKDNEDE